MCIRDRQYGVDLFEVSKLLGHKSIAQTQIYAKIVNEQLNDCLLYTSPSPRDRTRSRMPSSA